MIKINVTQYGVDPDVAKTVNDTVVVETMNDLSFKAIVDQYKLDITKHTYTWFKRGRFMTGYSYALKCLLRFTIVECDEVLV